MSKYLVVQRESSATSNALELLRKDLRASSIDVPRFPGVIDAVGLSPSGILVDEPDAVSYGAVRSEPVARDQSVELLVGIKSVIVLRQATLSLYAYLRTQRPDEIEGFKELSQKWIRCVREANR